MADRKQVLEELPFGEENNNQENTDNDMPCNYDYEENCLYSCATVHDFLSLTDEMVETIIDLEDELVRWRQVLVKYLPDDWAEGLRQDIFNNLSKGFEGDPAYDMYIHMKHGKDPQQSKKRIKRLYRLADGTDKTSITYL